MTTLIKKIAVGGIAVAAVLAFSGLASAGECPKDKMMAGAVTSGETMPKNVTDTLIASIDLRYPRERHGQRCEGQVRAGRASSGGAPSGISSACANGQSLSACGSEADT